MIDFLEFLLEDEFFWLFGMDPFRFLEASHKMPLFLVQGHSAARRSR